MKNVLWISRHRMTSAQLTDLERVAGGPVSLNCWTDTVAGFGSLLQPIAEADLIAAVLPPDKLVELLQLAGSRPVLRAVSARRPTGYTVVSAAGQPEAEFAFEHLYWEQILKAEIRTRRL